MSSVVSHEATKGNGLVLGNAKDDPVTSRVQSTIIHHVTSQNGIVYQRFFVEGFVANLIEDNRLVVLEFAGIVL